MEEGLSRSKLGESRAGGAPDNLGTPRGEITRGENAGGLQITLEWSTSASSLDQGLRDS